MCCDDCDDEAGVGLVGMGDFPDGGSDGACLCDYVCCLSGGESVLGVDMVENVIVGLIVLVAVVVSLRVFIKKDKGCGCGSEKNCDKKDCDMMER